MGETFDPFVVGGAGASVSKGFKLGVGASTGDIVEGWERAFEGDGRALLEFLRRTQRPEEVPGGQALVVELADLRSAKRRVGAELEVVFNVVRFAPLEEVLEEEVQ